MADVERDVLNIDWLPGFAEGDRRRISEESEAERPGLIDIAIVNTGALCSVALASLGLWKLVELVG